MLIFKPNNNKNSLDLDKNDDFFKYSHGAIDIEFTLCSIACEEWGYNQYTLYKKITCPRCMQIITECKKYKGK